MFNYAAHPSGSLAEGARSAVDLSHPCALPHAIPACGSPCYTVRVMDSREPTGRHFPPPPPISPPPAPPRFTPRPATGWHVLQNVVAMVLGYLLAVQGLIPGYLAAVMILGILGVVALQKGAVRTSGSHGGGETGGILNSLRPLLKRW